MTMIAVNRKNKRGGSQAKPIEPGLANSKQKEKIRKCLRKTRKQWNCEVEKDLAGMNESISTVTGTPINQKSKIRGKEVKEMRMEKEEKKRINKENEK